MLLQLLCCGFIILQMLTHCCICGNTHKGSDTDLSGFALLDNAGDIATKDLQGASL